jgi:hypothetical protein
MTFSTNATICIVNTRKRVPVMQSSINFFGLFDLRAKKIQ